MRARVDVAPVAFHRRPITALGLVQLALVEINIPQLIVVVGFVEMMDLSLEFLDSAPVMRAWQLEPARRRGRSPINIEVIPDRPKAPNHQDEQGPNPFPLP